MGRIRLTGFWTGGCGAFALVTPAGTVVLDRWDRTTGQTIVLDPLTGADPVPNGPFEVSDDGTVVAFGGVVASQARHAVVWEQGQGALVRTASTGATSWVTSALDPVSAARWSTWGSGVMSSDGTRVVLSGQVSGTPGLRSRPASCAARSARPG